MIASCGVSRFNSTCHFAGPVGKVGGHRSGCVIRIHAVHDADPPSLQKSHDRSGELF